MIFNFPNPSDVYFGAHIPEKHQNIFEGIIIRAVDLINLDPDETVILSIKQNNLEEMIISLCPEIFDLDYEQSEEESLLGHVSYAKLLYKNINSIELESGDTFSWSQYFGLLALAQINQFYFLLSFENTMPTEMLEPLEKTGIYCIADSIEAVCFGESLSSKMHTEILVKERISRQAQKAIRVRFQPLDDIKSSFVEFYLKASDKSNKSEIARKFYRSLNEDQQRVLTPSLKPENASRTLIRHINRLLNSYGTQ